MAPRAEASANATSAIARAFGMPDTPVLLSRAMRKSTFSLTELRGDGRNFGWTQPMPRRDAWLVALQLRNCTDHDLFFDGRHVRPRNVVAGASMFYDMRREPVANLRDPFHSLMLEVPRRALERVAEDAGAPRVGGIRCEDGVGFFDPVLRALLLAVRPALAQPAEASPLFLEHVAIAVTTHIAHVYGALLPSQRVPRGGLAPAKERRARELIAANLAGSVSLSTLAAECGLSVRHFTRAFRQSTGLSPHRWLQSRRVDLARGLLCHSSRSIADIALTCGFAGQSHLTRVFKAIAGIGPGAWRQAHRSDRTPQHLDA
jgi:AraC-like DNA-binding protein